MRVLFVLLVLALVGCAKEYGESDTVLSDGILYTKNDMKPVNGVLFQKNYTGKYKIGEFKNGLREGVHQEHFGKQLTKEGEYIKGKEQGTHRNWNEEGQLINEADFDKGLLNGNCKSWSSNGQLMYDGQFKSGRAIGIHKSWFYNGILEYEKTFEDGILIGKSKIFNFEGELIYILEMDGDVEIRTIKLTDNTSKKEFYRNRSLIKTEYFIGNRKVSKNEWWRYTYDY